MEILFTPYKKRERIRKEVLREQRVAGHRFIIGMGLQARGECASLAGERYLIHQDHPRFVCRVSVNLEVLEQHPHLLDEENP